jgi:hypothetical protein
MINLVDLNHIRQLYPGFEFKFKSDYRIQGRGNGSQYRYPSYL